MADDSSISGPRVPGMKVTTIGGGPGGLYASLLLARTHPDWEITVHERNPQGVTYGWGIVLPGRTLPNLEAADAPSHAAVAETVEQWEPFDVYYGGDRFRFDGNEFNSMLRTDLLELLQERCREVGVDLAFDSEITDPRVAAAEADLVVAADGIHSQTRAAFAEEFGTAVVDGDARFSWFGTDSDFEALSHIFVENEDGLWCAHTYPGPTSTFIIDCDVETWERSGVAEMDESAYLDYFEGVFEGYLDGEGLLSQRDRWMTFTTVRNDRWHHDNVVLVGDAAHTAHYSIGSGTTLALEDGIALMEAFEDHAGVDRALRAYESTRKPAAEALQLAGERSRVHFEDIRRFERLDPTQFAFHHVTRSGRLTYGSLSRRAPAFVGALDEWFAEHAAPGDQPAREPASQPARLGPTILRNRLVRPVGPARSAVDGLPDDDHLAAFGAAGTDPGLVLTDPVAVSTAGRPTAGSPGLYDDTHEAAWRGAVERLREREGDVAAGVHLTHAGPAAARDARPLGHGETGRADAWAPPVGRAFSTRPRAFGPDRLTADRRAAVRDAFRSATERARRAGFDHLQLDAGYDSLLLSALCDARDSSALGFVGEVLGAVRAAWPGDRSLGVTLGVGVGSVDLGEAFEITRALAADGVDVVAPVAGAPGEADPAAGSYGPAGYSDNVRNETGVTTLAVAHVTSIDKANTLVGTGRADLCTYHGPAPG